MGGSEMLDYQALAENVKSMVRLSMCDKAKPTYKGGFIGFGMYDAWECGSARNTSDLCDKAPHAHITQCAAAIMELVEGVTEDKAAEILSKMCSLGWAKKRSCGAVWFLA